MNFMGQYLMFYFFSSNRANIAYLDMVVHFQENRVLQVPRFTNFPLQLLYFVHIISCFCFTTNQASGSLQFHRILALDPQILKTWYPRSMNPELLYQKIQDLSST